MPRPGFALFTALLLVATRAAPVAAQQPPDLSGAWTLDASASELSREVGFNVDLPPDAADPYGRRGGGKRERPLPARRVSEDDAKRERQLTDEVRSPAARLTIVQTAEAVTVTDDKGRSRTFHPNGKEEVFQIAETVPVVAIARWEDGHLVVLYEVEEGRQITCSYSHPAGMSSLVLESRFVDHGTVGDTVTRVYEPSTPAVESAASRPGMPPAAPVQGAPPAGAPASGDSQTFDQRPGAEFRGLTTMGLVVEGLSGQSATCGLDQRALEDAVAKRLSAAGFTVRRNTDEDTYLYVNVMTAGGPNGLCVSRYDVSLSSHTTARLSYQKAPVLVEVTLLHKGGIAGGSQAGHADSVLTGVLGYVDQFTARIHAANQ